jgi:hypothetical protein
METARDTKTHPRKTPQRLYRLYLFTPNANIVPGVSQRTLSEFKYTLKRTKAVGQWAGGNTSVFIVNIYFAVKLCCRTRYGFMGVK